MAGPLRPFAPARAEAIVVRYVAGESLTHLVASEHTSVARVKRTLHDAGIALRPHAETVVTTHTCDHHYFDEMSDEPRAYWLGFLYADGCVSVPKPGRGGPRLDITLKAADADHLAAFRAAVGATHPIGAGTTTLGDRKYPRVRLAITSRILCEALARYGVVPRKSMTCSPPDLPAHLRSHFWRGVFDGDGCIRQKEGPHSSPQASVCGTRATCDGFATWIAAGMDQRAGIYPVKNHFMVELHGYSAILALRQHFYSEATVWLGRKRDYFDAIAARDRTRVNAPLIVDEERITREALSLRLGFGKSMVARRMRQGMTVEQIIALARSRAEV